MLSHRLHVAVMAFPFGCHPLSLLSLIQKLAIAAPETQFSFINTANSNSSLFSRQKQNNLPRNIKPYNANDGVPPNHDSSGNPAERVELFLKATPGNFGQALETAKAEMGETKCLVTDAFLPFGGAIAKESNVPWIPVWIPVPHSLSVHLYSDTIIQQVNDSNSPDNFVENIPGLDKFRISDLPLEFLLSETKEKSFLSDMLSQLGNVLPQASALIMNFYEELYPTLLLNDLKSKFPCLLNVGFVTLQIPPPPLPSSDKDATGCLSWLDSQKFKSVVYISFGTVVNIPCEEIVELAEALEESKIPFLWSLRENLTGNLPDGFLDRTRSHGKLVLWAPQTQLLAHNSVGVYITHCGANSVYESMANGVPTICRPVFADNKINARLVAEIWEIGVRVDEGIFTKKGVIKSLEKILTGENGQIIRSKATSLQELLLKIASPDRPAACDFNTLVENFFLK